MKTTTVTKVGIREFRAHLPKYVLTSVPVAVTRHGETVGYYIPTRHHTEQPELDGLIQAAQTLEKLLKTYDLTENQLLAEFRSLREKSPKESSRNEDNTKYSYLF